MASMLSIIHTLQEKGVIKANDIKDFRYYTKRYVTQVLGFSEMEACLPENYFLPLEERNILINLKLRDASEHVRRNMKRYIKSLLNLAIKEGIVNIPKPQSLSKQVKIQVPKWTPKQPKPRALPESKKYPTAPYALKFRNWPSELSEKFNAWHTQAITGENSAQRPLRETTIHYYKVHIEGYFGYCFNIRGIENLTFDLLLDNELQEDFVKWHSHERNGHRCKPKCITAFASKELKCAKGIAQHYFKDEEAAKRLSDLLNSFSVAPATFNKQDRASGVCIKDLLEITESEFPKIPPHKNRDGTVLAARAGKSIANLFLTLAPARNKNYREAILGEHIVRIEDPSSQYGGYWKTNFRGDDKIAALKMELDEQNHVRTYQIKFAAEYTPIIDEYVNKWRPLLIKKGGGNVKNFFLNSKGQPYTKNLFTKMIKGLTLKWLGKEVPPHTYRHIVASEFVNEKNDPATAAILLNDKIETVLAEYFIPNTARAEKVRDQYIQDIKQGKGASSLATMSLEEIEDLLGKVMMLRASGRIPDDLWKVIIKS